MEKEVLGIIFKSVKSEKILQNLGNQLTPNMGTMYGNLAMVYQNLNQLKQAQQYYMKQAQVYDKLYGNESVKNCSFLNNMSTFLMWQNKYQQAQQLLMQAIAIFQKNKIDNHSIYILTLTNLGQLHLQTLNKEKALQYLNRALKLYEVTVGKSDARYKNVAEQIANVDKSIELYKNPNWREAQRPASNKQKQKPNNNKKNNDSDDEDDDQDDDYIGDQNELDRQLRRLANL